MCAVMGFMALAGCGGALPSEVTGTWSTEDKRYEGRSLQITADTIVFVADEETKTVGSIRKVGMKEADGSTEVKITYVDKERESSTVELVYSPKDGGTLRFKNQPGAAWKRSDR
jgi:hypothetical protein